jgi:uncharacterized protein with GYD domain
MGAGEDIKATTGQYDASLGQQGNERSGKAIMAREKQGDTGTYHYVDNLARAVRYVSRQLVDMIPKIYDTQRVARIIGLDGDVDMVKINPTQPEAVKKITDENGIVLEKIYNPTVGVYDVCVTTGPGYMTKRQEALDAMQMLLQSNPDLWTVAGDLFIRNMDWPGAQEMAARFAKIIDPKVLAGNDESPEMQQAKQQMEAMGQQMEQMYGMLQNASKSIEAQDAQVKQFEAQVKAYDAETKRISVVQNSMGLEQIQDIVMGTLNAAMDTGDIVGNMQGRGGMPGMEEMQPEQMMPPEGQMMPSEGQMMPSEGEMMPPEGQMMPPQGAM